MAVHLLSRVNLRGGPGPLPPEESPRIDPDANKKDAAGLAPAGRKPAFSKPRTGKGRVMDATMNLGKRLAGCFVFPGATAAKLLALFLLILGAKLCLIRACSSPLPFYDQWQGEGCHVLQNWLRGQLTAADLFAPHTIHRILWTRLLVLGLFVVNGQWDTQVEMIAAAGLHALCAVALGGLLIRRLGHDDEDKILFGLLALFALPFAWENTLSGGFQSQYYFLILFGVGTIWGLGSHRPGSAAWWLGGVCAVLAWFSMASGPVASLAVAASMAWRLWWREGTARANGTTLAVASLLAAGGLSLSLGVHSGTEGLHPQSVGELAGKFVGLLGWPNPTGWAAAVAYAPFACFVWRKLRGRRPTDDPAGDFLFPLGMFTVLQVAAVAFARNHYRGLQVSRYMDILSLGTLVNLACLLLLTREARMAGAGGRVRALTGLSGALWIAVTCLGLANLTAHNFDRDLPFVRGNNAKENANVAAFVAAPDPRLLDGKTPFDFQGDHRATILAVLMDPQMRAILPSMARRPLAVVPAATGGEVRQLLPEAADTVSMAGWAVDPPGADGKISTFRSQTMQSAVAYLEFAVTGHMGPLVHVGLVGERSGRTTWLLPDADTNGWWRALVETPNEPFHLQAVVREGAAAGVSFQCPREVGRLSAAVESVFDSAFGLLFGGAALWLGVLFYQQGEGEKRMTAPTPARRHEERATDQRELAVTR